MASAADRVIVMMKSVAAKPSSTSTNSLPCQQESSSLQHRDRALAVRALRGHPPVHRQRAEQGDQHQDQGRERREHAGGQRGDARLVAERGEVVDARSGT